MPGENAFNQLSPFAEARQLSGFSNHHAWFTQYDPKELLFSRKNTCSIICNITFRGITHLLQKYVCYIFITYREISSCMIASASHRQSYHTIAQKYQ